ncbi:ferritin-like domain-containing protein [Arthrobacter sp. MI7-26]|uniref:ferritin-like domain-containing protein n=1 Tax=Arthrobacter sp. MI7-26 TaxID=2993653 RepID=UPI002248DD99|nr:ferritin-like domain-containing protein [Arthrobacter sp. MI7-26]MCX2747471.1 ferritin-like domain-containing protein [Arthrobacter sp. MI7-26]
MTLWSVVNHGTAEKPRSHGWTRALLLALLAVLVVGVGAVLVPRDAGKPQALPFSETARSEALSATEALLDSASLLEGTTPGGAAGEASGGSGLPDSVTLLTNQARALLPPSGQPASSASRTPGGASPKPPSPGSVSPSSAATPDTTTPTAFVSALSSSASRRLADAAQADGGTARLLAAVGTSQLLESSRLATIWGLPVPEATPGATPAPTPAPSCPALPGMSATAAPPPGTASSRADLPAAVGAVVSSEQEAIYAYQVALTKLDAKASATAATWLARHQELLRGAEAQGRLHCVATPPREAGYRLPASFAAKPGAALGGMEASSLTAYADLVALSDGETRQWAIDGLVDAAKRSQAWGTPVGPFPGLSIDSAALPPLPSSTPAP